MEERKQARTLRRLRIQLPRRIAMVKTAAPKLPNANVKTADIGGRAYGRAFDSKSPNLRPSHWVVGA